MFNKLAFTKYCIYFYRILLLQTYKIKKQDAFIFNKHDFINKIYKLL